jgi:hypothetical protein
MQRKIHLIAAVWIDLLFLHVLVLDKHVVEMYRDLDKRPVNLEVYTGFGFLPVLHFDSPSLLTLQMRSGKEKIIREHRGGLFLSSWCWTVGLT